MVELEQKQGNTTDGVQTHQLKVTSLENQNRDHEEIAQIVMTNGVTGKEHTFSVWAGDIERNELKPYYVYLNNPKEISKDDNLNMEDSLCNALYDSTLSDIVKMNDNIERSIKEYTKDEDKTFSIEIPKNQQNLDLHSMIVDEEVADLLLKNDKEMLSKEDIINFGKLVEHDNENTFDFNKELKDSFEAILDKEDIKQDEIKHINSAFKTLNIESDMSHFSKNKSIEKPTEELELPF